MSIRAIVPVSIHPQLKTDIVSFAFKDHVSEDIAVLFPGWKAQESVLLRIHSECLTGDVFGSERCDCGAQLTEAKGRMAQEGGILLYLRQEGRGIGLYNKLDAYKLQIEDKKDTFEANIHLGLPADARNYTAAALMLADLGVKSVRIMTNNPEKVRVLAAAGIVVTEVIPTILHTTPDNISYLEAKRRHGHTMVRPVETNRG